jgi:hypothetical protein
VLGEALETAVQGQLNVTLSALRDAITAPAPNARTLADLYTQLSAILAQLNLTTTGLRDALTASISTDQPRHLTNWPAGYPDALAESRLASILAQLDVKTGTVRDGIVTAIEGMQPRSVTNFPADYPDALSESRLASILAPLDRPESEIWDVKSAQGAVTAATDTAGLTITLDLGTTGRAHVQRCVRVTSASVGVALELEITGCR